MITPAPGLKTRPPRYGVILALAIGAATLTAGPSRFGFSDRIERHLFPEVTIGPAWSPDKRFVSKEDAKFLADVVDAIWARTSKSRWRSDAERDAFKAEIDRAKAVYKQLETGSK